jgi:hypothetical protein
MELHRSTNVLGHWVISLHLSIRWTDYFSPFPTKREVVSWLVGSITQNYQLIDINRIMYNPINCLCTAQLSIGNLRLSCINLYFCDKCWFRADFVLFVVAVSF